MAMKYHWLNFSNVQEFEDDGGHGWMLRIGKLELCEAGWKIGDLMFETAEETQQYFEKLRVRDVLRDPEGLKIYERLR
jgi:hypothetical protein